MPGQVVTGVALTSKTRSLDCRTGGANPSPQGFKVALMSGSGPACFLLQRGSRGKGAAAPFPCTPNPRRTSSASLRTISLDDSEHLFQNHHVSVASLRLLFTFAPECRSASLRNRCSPSPEYPVSAGRRGSAEVKVAFCSQALPADDRPMPAA